MGAPHRGGSPGWLAGLSATYRPLGGACGCPPHPPIRFSQELTSEQSERPAVPEPTSSLPLALQVLGQLPPLSG